MFPVMIMVYELTGENKIDLLNILFFPGKLWLHLKKEL